MPDKRKRIERKKIVVSKSEPEVDISRKVTGKLHHCLRDVRKAAKKAKTFEVQKLVKKLKALRAKYTGSPEISGLEEELEILKRTDHEPFAHTALKTKIKKDKMLSQDQHMSEAVAKELASDLVEPAASGSHLAKVNGRLLSSKVLAAEVSRVVEELRAVLHPEQKALNQKEQTDEEDEEDDAEDADAESAPQLKKPKISRDTGESETDEEGDEEGLELRQLVFNEDEGGDDGGWESGSVDGGEQVTSHSEDDSDSEDGDEEELEDEGGQEKLPLAKSGTTNRVPATSSKSKSAVESTFLPSLSVGFTHGDSDDDWSDREAGVADGVRKNRRGQRARRAIWEKKYGKNANHVKEQEASAQEPGRKGKLSFVQKHGKSGPGRQERPPNAPVGSANELRPKQQTQTRPSAGKDMKKEEKPLHPSWEAKKKLKEKLNPNILPPQGKKIVF